MKLELGPDSIDRWYWMPTPVAIVAGLAGRVEGLCIAVAISAVQVVHFLPKDGFAALATPVCRVCGNLTIQDRSGAVT